MPYRALRVFGDGEEVVTASPTQVCVWKNMATVGMTEGLVAGPFTMESGIKSKEDLVDWYSDWVRDGRQGL